MTAWHATDLALSRYADGTGGDLAATSLEAHVLVCDVCRRRIAELLPAERLSTNWDGVVAALDAPRRGMLERALLRLRVPGSTARLLAATPTFRLSWITSIALALAFGAVAAATPGNVLFLVLAPLVPVVGVAVAFSGALDPSHAMAAATPLGGLRLLFLRSVASLLPSLVFALTFGLLADAGRGWALWLLPAVALSAATIAAASVVTVEAAAASLGTLWAFGALASEAFARGGLRALRSGGAPESLLFDTPGQLAALVVLVAAAAVAVARADTLPAHRSPA